MSTSFSSVASYLSSEASKRAAALGEGHPVITLSREEGAGGELIAERAREILTERSRGQRKWLVIDKSIAEEIIRHHNLPARIRDFLNDEEVSYVRDMVEELIGLHPDRALLIKKMIETILHLAQIGNVIFIGRATHMILRGLPEARHIRIVGALELRAQRITAQTGLPDHEARTQIKKVERARRRFVQHFFHVDLRDPHGYDLTLNTDRLSIDEAARIVADIVPSPSPLVREEQWRSGNV